MDKLRHLLRSRLAVGLAVSTAVSTLVSLVLCCVLLLLVNALYLRVVESDELPGTYRLDDRFIDCPVTLTLHNDGAFDEVVACPEGKTFQNAGKWHVAVTRTHVYVVLENSIFATATFSAIDPPRPKRERFHASRDYGGRIQLVRNLPDYAHVFEKIDQ